MTEAQVAQKLCPKYRNVERKIIVTADIKTTQKPCKVGERKIYNTSALQATSNVIYRREVQLVV